MNRRGFLGSGWLLCCFFLCAGQVEPDLTARLQTAGMANRAVRAAASGGTFQLTKNTDGAKANPEQQTGSAVQRLTVKAGQNFTIVLESNPSTGYGWELTRLPDTTVVELVKKDFAKPDTDRLGAAGKEVWIFKAVGKGKTEIGLEYARPWEKDQPPERILTYEVTVE